MLAPEHVDGGLFTLIYTSDTGLQASCVIYDRLSIVNCLAYRRSIHTQMQVRDPASGEWVDVEPADYSSGGAVGRVTVPVGA